MANKPGFLPQVLFALGVVVVIVALIGRFLGEFEARYAASLGLVGLVLAVGAWRRMRR